MLPAPSPKSPPAPRSIAATLAPEILALIPSHLNPEERQRACHSMNIVSRSWYLATREDASFVVTRASQADALLSRLREEASGARVRSLYLTCSETGGFTDSHRRSFMDLLAQCSSLVALDLSMGPRQPVGEITVWKETECYASHSPRPPPAVCSEEGDVLDAQDLGDYSDEFAAAFAESVPTGLKYFNLESHIKVIDIDVVARMLAPLSSLEDLHLSTNEFWGPARAPSLRSKIPNHWPEPPRAPLRRLAVGFCLDEGMALPLLRWLLRDGPAVPTRSIDVGDIFRLDILTDLCDILQRTIPETSFRPHLWYDEDDPAYTKAITILSRLTPITSIHVYLSNLTTEHWDGTEEPDGTAEENADTAVIHQIQNIPSLQHLILHIHFNVPLIAIKEPLSQKTLISFGLEWSAAPLDGGGPTEEDFETVREVAISNGVRFYALREEFY